VDLLDESAASPVISHATKPGLLRGLIEK